VKTALNLAYGKNDLQQLDLYLPDQPNGAAIVFAHGGGWFRGDKAHDTDIGNYFAKAGYVTAIPNYRLAPADLYPAAQDDFEAAITWLTNSDYQFDRSRVGLLGASVGGTMTLTASLKLGYPVASWSGVTDFADWMQKHQVVKPTVDGKAELGLTEIHAIHDAFYKYFIQTYLGDLTPAKLTAVNPLNHLSTKLGPTLMYNSIDELTPLPGTLRFVEQAAAFGRDVTLHVVPGSGHARDYTDFALPGTRAFFDYHLLRR
jgi:acetyl esterase/lipase